jgi:hypothetical protein
MKQPQSLAVPPWTVEAGDASGSIMIVVATDAPLSDSNLARLARRELAWAAAECLDQPLGEPANAINSHFIWHDFCLELIRLTGNRSTLEHTAGGDDFFAQPWTYSGERLAQRLGFRSQHQWQETLATALAETGRPDSTANAAATH